MARRVLDTRGDGQGDPGALRLREAGCVSERRDVRRGGSNADAEAALTPDSARRAIALKDPPAVYDGSTALPAGTGNLYATATGFTRNRPNKARSPSRLLRAAAGDRGPARRCGNRPAGGALLCRPEPPFRRGRFTRGCPGCRSGAVKRGGLRRASCAYRCAYRYVSSGGDSLQLLASSHCPICRSFLLLQFACSCRPGLLIPRSQVRSLPGPSESPCITARFVLLTVSDQLTRVNKPWPAAAENI